MSSICNICEGKLEDGRALPCGKWACNLCIDFLSTTDKKQMKCKNCDKKHEIPPNGFPPESDSVSQIHEAKIRENCDQAREKVKKAIAEAYHKLDTYQAEFLHEIDAHEQKCLDNLSLVSQNKAEIRQIMERPKNLKSAIDNASQLLENIDKAESDLKQILFFVENKKDTFCKNLLGQVKLKSSDVLFLQNLAVFREISLKAHLNDAFFTYNNSEIFKLDLFPNGKHFAVVYQSNNKNINITLFDMVGNVVKQRKNIITNKHYSNIEVFNMFISSNAIFLAISQFYSNIYSTKNRAIQLLSFDFELNERKLFELNFKSICLDSLYGCFEEKFFVLTQENFSYILMTIYNSELNVIDQIKLGDLQQINNLFLRLCTFVITCDYLCFYKPYEDKHSINLTLLNRTNGTLLKSVKMPLFNYFFSYSDKYLTFDMHTATIRVFNRDFGLLDEIQIDEIVLNKNDRVNKIPYLQNKQICFFDANKLSLTLLENNLDH